MRPTGITAFEEVRKLEEGGAKVSNSEEDVAAYAKPGSTRSAAVTAGAAQV